DLHLLLCQQRPGDGGSEEIFVLVDAAGADELPEILRDKLLAHIFDIDFSGASLASLFFEAGEFIAALSDIAANSDDFAAVVFLQPRDDDGGIEAARIGEGHFLRFRHGIPLWWAGREAYPTGSLVRAPFGRGGGFPPGRTRPSAGFPSRNRWSPRRAW